MMIVLARGMSRPLSMIAVAHEDVVAALDEVEHRLLERALAHLPVAPTAMRAVGHELAARRCRALVEALDAVVDVEAPARRAPSSRVDRLA